jgi:hypothetical protein
MTKYESVEGCVLHLPHVGYVIWPASNPPKKISQEELYELNPRSFKTSIKGHKAHEYRFDRKRFMYYLNRGR